MEDEELIVIKKSSVKRLLAKLFIFLVKAYTSINKETTLFWRRLFKNEYRIRLLLESDALVLLFNTLLFAFIGNVFKGLIGEVMLATAFLNILTFCIIKLEWHTKLAKYV